MMKIGAIDIPYHEVIDPTANNQSEDVWDAYTSSPLPFEESLALENIVINGTLVNNATYPKTLNQQIEDALALVQLGVGYNSINVPDLKGFLSVRSVKPKLSALKAGLREVSLDALLYPISRYIRQINSNPVILANDWSITLGTGGADNYIPLPIGATYNGGDGSTITRAGKDGTVTLVKANTSKNINFDLTADEVNVGECKVWDTLGLAEANWIRVFNKDHIFSGNNDCVIENGLIRIRIDANNIVGIVYLSWYTGAVWSSEQSIEFQRDQSVPNESFGTIRSIKVTTINPDVVRVVTVWETSKGNHMKAYIDLYRGEYTFDLYYEEMDNKTINGASRYNGFGSDYTLYWNGTNWSIYDTLIEGGINPIFTLFNVAGDSYYVGINKTLNAIGVAGVRITGSSARCGNNMAVTSFSLSPLTKTFVANIGVLYATWVANLFKECEAMTQGSGVAFYTGVDASPKSGNTGTTIDAQGEYCSYNFTPGTDLPLGTYKLFLRAKDSTHLANDISIELRDDSAGGAIVTSQSWTGTASWAYYSMNITLDASVNSHNLRVKVTKFLAGANVIDVDYVLWVPISLDSKNGPQDIAHQALVNQNLNRQLVQR